MPKPLDIPLHYSLRGPIKGEITKNKEYKYDVSVIIPFAAEDINSLWFTLQNIASTLVHSKLTHEIIVIANNTGAKYERCPQCNNKFQPRKSQPSEELARGVLTGRDFANFHNTRMLVVDRPSNASAANAGAVEAKGKYLCFADEHIIVHPNMFTECIKTMERHGDAGLVHPYVNWSGAPYGKNFESLGGRSCFQYLYREYDKKKPGVEYWTHAFHGVYNSKKCANEPYPILGCGHGVYMIKHDVWERLGGKDFYHNAQSAVTGREAAPTFKSWLFGYKNYSVCTAGHQHSNLSRSYFWTNDYSMQNNMQMAYIIGGTGALDVIYMSMSKKPGVRPEVLKALRETAQATSEEHRKFVLANQKLEFKDLFDYCDSVGAFC